MLSKYLLTSLNQSRKKLDVTQQSASGGYVFPPPPQASLPVRGTTQRFPVHRIYCVGRNYAEHAIEMGHDPKREAPFFFQKNPDTLVPDGGKFPYPDRSTDVHHELELVVALARGGRNIAPKDAAADWALDRLPSEHRVVVARARAVYLGEADDDWTDLRVEVRACAELLEAEVRRAAR